MVTVYHFITIENLEQHMATTIVENNIGINESIDIILVSIIMCLGSLYPRRWRRYSKPTDIRTKETA
jgi:hypothetical protein